MKAPQVFLTLAVLLVMLVLAWMFTDLVVRDGITDAQLVVVVSVFMTIINVASSIISYTLGQNSKARKEDDDV